METAQEVPGEGRKEKHAIISQNTFQWVIKRAESRGMKVNTSKTNMLCVSDSLALRSHGYILEEGGSRITSVGTDSIKILGFHFGSRPNVQAHVQSLLRRFFECWWVLYHLKHHGFNTE